MECLENALVDVSVVASICGVVLIFLFSFFLVE